MTTSECFGTPETRLSDRDRDGLSLQRYGDGIRKKCLRENRVYLGGRFHFWHAGYAQVSVYWRTQASR